MLRVAICMTVAIVVGSALHSLPGVHEPLQIDPVVDILPSTFVLDLYETVLGREFDPAGLKTQVSHLEQTQDKEAMFNVFTSSQEFLRNPALVNKNGYITRLYQRLLHRDPSQQDLADWSSRVRSYDGSGAGFTWFETTQLFYSSAEYKNANCQRTFFSLGDRVNASNFLLASLFDGSARLQEAAEAERLFLSLPSALAVWDQKLPMLPDGGGGFIAFTRVLVQRNPDAFNIALLHSPDGVHFSEGGLLFDRVGSQTFYDAHVSVDNSVCPTRYVMAMECVGHEGAASMCISSTATPSIPESWSPPLVVVDGCVIGGAVCKNPAAESASTGVTLTDGNLRYLSWTQVYDGVRPNDPLAHTYSQFVGPVGSYGAYFGTVLNGGVRTMMSSEPHPMCGDGWDCNNRDKQDWKREGGYFYALYNGANYYRCDGTWGISVARSPTAVGGEYAERVPLARGIRAVRSDTCGASYPVLNVVNGELFVYYAFVLETGENVALRSRLVAA